MDQDNGHLIREDDAATGELPTLRFRVPGKDAPGFLRRQREALAFAETLSAKENVTAAVIERIVEFLLPYVTVPQERDAARQALWDMSEDQFYQLLNAVTGADVGAPGAATVPLAISGSSAAG
jgi:hypothetical protein